MTSQQQSSEEAYVGKDLGSRQYLASDEILGNYFNGLEIDTSWYSSDELYGKGVAPSMALTEVEVGFPGAGFKNNFGTLWIRQQWDVKMPITPGEEYKATARVVDVYEHRNRKVVNQESTLWSHDGEIMALGNHHQSFMINQSSGKVALRDPNAKAGIRRFNIPEGELVEGDPHTISLEMCGTFFHGNANYHTNKKAAEELGFNDVVVGGRMTMSYIGDLMDRRFGRAWFKGGNLDLKFTNIVWPGDTVIPKAVVTGETTEDGEKRANVATWMEKEDGTVVIVGTASVGV
ncbi:MAG: MaoC/PaaZ C-terminal domain-containing protein [SAR202 cluster bacterium]|nr:MaoC/PaaZ C-terminal domain-containing protein [SAR202 cluster bacterium]